VSKVKSPGPGLTSTPSEASGVGAIHYESAVFKKQFHIVKRFVYHLIYYRALDNAYKESKLKSEFWTLTIDAHLLQAAIHWCMVFGSDGCNATHWKRLSTNQSEMLQQSFRNGLFKQPGLDCQRWEQYWNDMTGFRNNYAAHRELDFRGVVPNFDTALTVVYYYDKWVRKVISPDSFAEPLLKAFASKLMQSTSLLADRILKATTVN
jgi:hypothetical protein